MEYKYLKIREIIEKFDKVDIEDSLDDMNLDFEADAEKEELITILEEGLKQHIIEVYYMLSHDDLVILNKMKENNGEYTFADDFDEEKGPSEEFEALFSLLELCLIHTDFEENDMDHIHAHVSREFIEIFEPYLIPERLSMAAYLDEAAKIIQGALYYYGALDIDKLYEIVSANHGNMDRKFFNRVLSYKISLMDAYSSVMYEDKEYIVDIDFDLFYEISDIRRWNKGQGYKAFEKADFIEASDVVYIEHEEEYEKLYDYFEEFFIQDDEIIEMYPHIPEEFYFAFHLDQAIESARKTPDMDNVIEEFMSYMEFEKDEEYTAGVKILVDYLNKITRWDNHGFANDEMPRLKLERNVVHMKAYVSKKENE